MTTPEVGTLLTSLAAIAIAVWSGIVSKRTAKESMLLQRRLLTLETRRERDRLVHSRRARLIAAIEPGDLSRWVLSVRNEGTSEARAVSVVVNGQDIQRCEDIFAAEGPVTALGPDSGVSFRLAVSGMGPPPVYEVSISWEDDSDEPGHWRGQLTLT